MFVLAVLALFGTTLSAELDPSLTEWTRINSTIEKVMFPLRDYILEVKTFRPDVYDTNPPYGQLLRTDKPTTMMAMLHAGSWNSADKVGRLVWNTIKYDRGFDVTIEECNAGYHAYNSFPAGGAKEQIWNWNFFDELVLLTCNDELQYSQSWAAGEVNPRKPGLPASCRALGQAPVDRIIFRHMEGEYIRGRPKHGKEPTDPKLPTTPAPTTPAPTTPTGNPDPITIREYPTCNCWTKECGYCSNLECTVQHDIAFSESGVVVSSVLNKKDLNGIVLYNEEGEILGKFKWNLKGIYLDGCIACRTPRRLRRAKAAEGPTEWEFSLTGAVVRLKIGGEVLYENVLRSECAAVYRGAARFAFYNMGCENTFTLSNGMKKGSRITPDCAGACPAE